MCSSNMALSRKLLTWLYSLVWSIRSSKKGDLYRAQFSDVSDPIIKHGPMTGDVDRQDLIKVRRPRNPMSQEEFFSFPKQQVHKCRRFGGVRIKLFKINHVLDVNHGTFGNVTAALLKVTLIEIALERAQQFARIA